MVFYWLIVCFQLTTNEKLKILESSLVDYLVISNSSDIIIYACTFYVGEWYKETVEDIENARLKHKESLPTKETEKVSYFESSLLKNV